MSIGVTEEHAALAQAVRGWAARDASMEVVRAAVDAEGEERPGFWNGLVAQGITAMHIAEEFGGAGATVVDLGVALEELGRAVAPGPFLPTTFASTLLQLAGPDALRKELLPGLADGTRTAAVAIGLTGLTATSAGNDLTVSGTVRPVLGAAIADSLILSASLDGRTTWFVVDASDVTTELIESFDATRRLAAVTLNAVTVPGDHVLPDLDAGTVRDVAAALFAAEAAGVAAWCLETAAEYAKVREQFGRPIGQFQAVKHVCADMLVKVEEIRAAAWDACVAVTDAEQRPLASAVAGVVALDAAAAVAKDCIQILGGIGFTWEHDAHLYLKRATTLRSLLGGTHAWRDRVTTLALAGTRRELALDLPEDEAAPFRAEVSAFVAEVEGLDPRAEREKMSDAGYAVPHWPKPYGRGAGAIEQLVIDEEFAKAGLRKPNLIIGGWVVPTIIQHGTEAQQEQFVLPTLYGDITWCQMFSEPGAGSDLAALQTKATRVEGGWVLNGQKVWTSLAHKSDWSICIARTSPDKPKHEGITAFLIDMKSEGLDIRPLREITGMALFNEIFLNDVFVPDDMVVGAVDDGWRLARATLANERVAMSSGSSMGSSVENVLEAVAASEEHRANPVLRDQVGWLVTEGQVLSLLGFRTTLRQLSGIDPGAGGSVRKLVGTLHAQDCAELVIDLLGAEGATTEGPAQTAAFTFLNTRCLTIAGGTTAVQRNVIAERMLGLPRDPAPGE